MIQINNITEHQHNLLNKMWAFDTAEEFEEWRSALNAKDRCEVIILKELILIEVREQEMVDEYKPHAKAILRKIMYNE